ncbi:MAG: hypothetical protein HW416_2616 [Chloroflexi bacterium]|nr:hypothetical protein [Chloroflexota bacterium]
MVIDRPTPTSTPIATIGPVDPCGNLTAILAVRIRESPTRPSARREGFFDVFTEIAPPGDPASSFFDVFYGDLDIMRKCGGDPQSLRSFFDVFADPLMKASEEGTLDSFFDVFTELPMMAPPDGGMPSSFFDVFTELPMMAPPDGDAPSSFFDVFTELSAAPPEGSQPDSFFDVFFDVFQPGGENSFFDVFFDAFAPDQKASFFDVFTEFGPSQERRQHAPVVFIKEWSIIVVPPQAPIPMVQ